MKLFYALVLALSLVGCGYAPSSKFARVVVGESVSTSVIVSQEDPQNSVLVKDAIDSAIIEVFRSTLTSKDSSDTHLTISSSNPRYTATAYDSNGYIVGYRMSINLNIKRDSKRGEAKTYRTAGQYDFSIEARSIITDQQRFESIKIASQRAINAFLATVAAEGARDNKNKAEP
ncbi:MAG: hypothetical protein WCR69_03490 [Sulfuricurvum sp.]